MGEQMLLQPTKLLAMERQRIRRTPQGCSSESAAWRQYKQFFDEMRSISRYPERRLGLQLDQASNYQEVTHRAHFRSAHGNYHSPFTEGAATPVNILWILNAILALSDHLRHPKEQLKRYRCRWRVNFHLVKSERCVLSDHVPSKCVSICQTRCPI